MRYPYERFLRFLLSRKVDVNGALERLGLPQASSLWLSEQRGKLRRSAPRTVLHYLDSDAKDVVFKDGFLAWAGAENIQELWLVQPEFLEGVPDPAIEAACPLFMNPLKRAILGMLLLARIPVPEIIEIANGRFGTTISVDTLASYSSIFWDVEATDPTIWPDLIASMTREERHYLAIGFEGTTVGEMRYFLGLVDVVDPEEILKNVARHAYHMFTNAMETPSPANQHAFKWGELALKAVHEMNAGKKTAPIGQGKGVNMNPKEMFDLFSVRVERSPIPSLSDLQGEISKPARAGGK